MKPDLRTYGAYLHVHVSDACTFTVQARDAGRVRKKWLIVNLQDSQEFVSQVLNRDVWSNYTIKDMINKDFIFWQVHACTCMFV